MMKEAKGLVYDDPRSDSDATVMGADGLQGLIYLCVMRLLTPHLTPQGV